MVSNNDKTSPGKTKKISENTNISDKVIMHSKNTNKNKSDDDFEADLPHLNNDEELKFTNETNSK